MKLLILADDFTGAMDTSVKFAKKGYCTRITNGIPEKGEQIPDCTVWAINMDIREVPPAKAYEITKELLNCYKDQAEAIYLKTDSALRGNLSAVFAAAEETFKMPVYFVPAYPKYDRITEKGIHYIGKEPLENSVFRIDPQCPMTVSRVRDILRMDYPVRVQEVRRGEKLPHEKKGIVYVIDGSTDEDLNNTADQIISAGNYKITAGCAGFAEALSEKLACLEVQTKKITGAPTEKGSIFIVSGSANSITFRQLEKAIEKKLTVLTLRNLFDDKDKERQNIKKAMKSLEREKFLALAVAVQEKDLIENNQNPLLSGRILKKMAGTAVQILRQKKPVCLAVFGGNTICEILKELSCKEVEVLGEIEEGVPISRMKPSGQILVTKSGGLGSLETVLKMVEFFKHR